MSEQINCFPKSKIEALAILYLQNQDLTNKSPEEIATMYTDTQKKLIVAFKNQ